MAEAACTPSRMNPAWLIELIGQHALHVASATTASNDADHEAEHGQGVDHRPPLVAVRRAKVTTKTRSSPANPAALTTDAMNAVDRGRRALVDVGRPGVERHRGHLEAEAHEHQREAGEQQPVAA